MEGEKARAAHQSTINAHVSAEAQREAKGRVLPGAHILTLRGLSTYVGAAVTLAGSLTAAEGFAVSSSVLTRSTTFLKTDTLHIKPQNNYIVLKFCEEP